MPLFGTKLLIFSQLGYFQFSDRFLSWQIPFFNKMLLYMKIFVLNVCRLKNNNYICNGFRTEPQPDKIGINKMNTNIIKDFFKSGDVIAFFVLAVVVVVLVAVFGTIEYTPTASDVQPITNLISSGVTYMNL